MWRLRSLGLFLFVIGSALLSIFVYEEFSNNLNYYYNYQVNFVLLVLVGTLSLTYYQKQDTIVNTTFSIRQMESSDIDGLKQITHTPFPRFFQDIAAQSQYSEAQVLVSEVDGTAVGFVKLVKFHLDSDKFGCILGVAVLPQFRRKGIATELVKTGTKCLKYEGAKAVFATAEPLNFASIGAFKKAGFRRMSFLSSYRLFGGAIFEFHRDIRYALGQTVLIQN